MKNSIYYFVLCLSAIIIGACVAPETKRELINNDFVSNNPALKINFKKKIIDFEEKDLKYWFDLGGGSFVTAEIHKGQHSTTIDYYYSLETIVKSLGDTIYVGPSLINGHEWARYAHIRDSKLVVGYLTRKGNDFVDIYTYLQVSESLNISYKKYQKTLIVTDDIKSEIDKYFKDFDGLIEIVY